MPRTVSSAAIQAMMAQSTDEAFLSFLVIDHADLVAPLRFVNDKTNKTRNAETYVAFPFEIKLPDDDEERLAEIELIIPTVDQQIQIAIREVTSAFTVELVVALASSPDTAEAGPFTFEALGAEFGRTSATIKLGFHSYLLNETFPKGRFAPSNAGLDA